MKAAAKQVNRKSVKHWVS